VFSPHAFQILKTSHEYISEKNTFLRFYVYSIEIEKPHTYFVSDHSFNYDEKTLHTFILTHNGIPALGLGFSFIFDKTVASVAFSEATASIGGFGLAMGPTGLVIGGITGLGWLGYNLFFKKDKQKQNVVHIERANREPGEGDGPEKDPKKRIINTMTKAEFFRQVKDQYEHFKDTVYQLKDRAAGLLDGKAQYLKWDHLHSDVEVFNRGKDHLGSLDPKTMQLYKGPVSGRKPF
jgi:hypothetical protein